MMTATEALTYYCDSPTTQALCKNYGSYLQGVSVDDLSFAAFVLTNQAHLHRVKMLKAGSVIQDEIGQKFNVANRKMRPFWQTIGEICLKESEEQCRGVAAFIHEILS